MASRQQSETEVTVKGFNRQILEAERWRLQRLTAIQSHSAAANMISSTVPSETTFTSNNALQKISRLQRSNLSARLSSPSTTLEIPTNGQLSSRLNKPLQCTKEGQLNRRIQGGTRVLVDVDVFENLAVILDVESKFRDLQNSSFPNASYSSNFQYGGLTANASFKLEFDASITRV